LGIFRIFLLEKKKLRYKISLLNPFNKYQKIIAKGVILKSPDIKIIMYVCIPLNKIFGFQDSKILVVN